MNRPRYVVIHCSDSTRGDRDEIEEWHLARGFAGIGYHYVILNGRVRRKGRTVTMPELDGCIEAGRPEHVAGAHCKGMNAKSIGICLVGRGEYTAKQMATLRDLVRLSMDDYRIPAERVLGHREADPASKKLCPLMDMDAFRASLEEPDATARTA